jgi:hypothetical protein
MSHTRARFLACAAGLTLLAPLTGCSTFTPFSGALFATKEVPAAAPEEPQGKVVIELRGAGKQPKAGEMPLAGNMYVHDAIKYSRASRKFRRMDVVVYRVMPNGNRHRLQSQYDYAKNEVVPEFDYALMPGDYVVLEEDTKTIVDDMLTAAAGPLASRWAGRRKL